MQLEFHQLDRRWEHLRVRHAARLAVASPEQAAAHEYHKTRLAKVREDLEAIVTVARDVLRRRPSDVRTWP